LRELGIKGAAYTILMVMAVLHSALSHADSFADKVAGLSKKTGFYNLYGDIKKQALLLEVDKLNQPFIYVTSLIQGVGSNDLGLDRGQIGDSRLVQFERVGQRVILRQLNPYYRAISDNSSEVNALDDAFAQSILFGFDIVAERAGSLLIDVNKFAIADFHGVAATLQRQGEGNYRINKDTSMAQWQQTKAFERNTEISALVTFNGEPKGRHLANVTPDARYVSIKFRHSLVALPESGYQTRDFHPYSSYFPFSFQDYSQPIAKPLTQRYIYRHRLQKDQQGRVIKPIIYYLDPGVPEPVRSALLDGASWWSSAFDEAGFSGGFKVEMLPADADPLDIKYNVIQWVHRSTRGWSYGSSVADPRTGEIMKGHVTLGSLRVRQDHLIASGLLAGQPKEQAAITAQEMALARIRQLAAHEVGHTLGIAHNFASSVNQRASVMDYPHPLIELKNQQIDLSNAYGVGLGVWDHYSIDYGYGEHQGGELLQLIEDTQQTGLKFISDRDARGAGSSNPWAHLWDNGAKADVELTRLMLVREIALKNIDGSLLDATQAHSELREAIVPIYLLHRFQVEAASKIIAGVDYDYALVSQPLKHRVVEAAWQRQALQALLNTLSSNYLTLPAQLLNRLPPKAYGFSQSRESFGSQNGLNVDPLNMAEASARNSLKYLLHSARINRLVLQHASNDEQLSLDEVLGQLIDFTLAQSQERGANGVELLVAQRINTVVVEQLLKALHHKSVSTQAKVILSERLTALHKWLVKKAKRGDRRYRDHSRWLASQLDKALDDASHQLIEEPAKLPPGSPI